MHFMQPSTNGRRKQMISFEIFMYQACLSTSIEVVSLTIALQSTSSIKLQMQRHADGSFDEVTI